MKRYLLILTFLFLNILSLKAQQFPVYSQYFLDPFLYNVGYVGVKGYTELNLNYRQQWVGIEDAPVTSTFNLQIPTKGKVSYAISAYSDMAVLLRNSAMFGTFGYRLAFSNEHFLNFGLSAGVGMSQLDVNEIDFNDPALANAYSTSYYLDGQFGVYYALKNFNLGVSMPKLFGTETVSTEEFQEIKLSPLENMIYSASYKFEMPGNMFSVTPYFLYRSNANVQNQIEASAILDYKDILYLGGAYRIDYGPSLFFGFGYNEIFKFGYAYEMATEQSTKLGQGTHEFQVSFKLGKQKRNPKVVEPKSIPEQVPVEEPQVEEVVPPPVAVIPLVVVAPKDSVKSREEDRPTEPEPAVEEPVVVVTEPEPVQSDDGFKPLTPGIYIVVGVFASENNAQNYSGELLKSGYKNDIRTNKEGKFYIIIDSPENMNSAKEFRKKTIAIDKFDFKHAWILKVE